MSTRLRFATDDDLLFIETSLDKICPRQDPRGNPLFDWDKFHQRAMDEIERILRATKSTDEPFELGRLGLRTKERLREVAACFALHFLFFDRDKDDGSGGTYFHNKWTYYRKRAEEVLAQESRWMDYDTSNDGDIQESEKNRPFANRFIRG